MQPRFCSSLHKRSHRPRDSRSSSPLVPNDISDPSSGEIVTTASSISMILTNPLLRPTFAHTSNSDCPRSKYRTRFPPDLAADESTDEYACWGVRKAVHHCGNGDCFHPRWQTYGSRKTIRCSTAWGLRNGFLWCEAQYGDG